MSGDMFSPPAMAAGEISHRFAFHPALSEGRRRNHEWIRGLCADLAVNISSVLPVGREASLAITKLEEVMFWANAGLARSADREAVPATVLTPVDRAKAAYARYGAVTDHKNFQGNPMPAWDDLTDTIQAAWIAAASG